MHRILFALALALSALAVHPAASADAFEEAQALHRQGQRDAALARLDAQLQRNPRDARARFLKGVILSEQQRTADAIALFTSLTQDFPEMPEPYNNLAVLHASHGNYRAAREALEMALRTHPDYATAHENLGDVYAALAGEAYAAALRLDVDNARAREKLDRLGQIVPGAASTAASPAAEPAASPADEPAPNAPPAVDARAELLAAVEGWAQAWSQGDAAAYLSYYAPAFTPPDGTSRAAWEAQRRGRLELARDLRVSVVSPRVTLDDDRRASVTFRQDYASPTVKHSVLKTLQLIKQDGRWLIESEIVSAN